MPEAGRRADRLTGDAGSLELEIANELAARLTASVCNRGRIDAFYFPPVIVTRGFSLS